MRAVEDNKRFEAFQGLAAEEVHEEHKSIWSGV